jgi:DNA processing protein
MAELIYRIALSMVPGIGDVQAKSLVSHFGDATSIFKARPTDLEALDGMGSIRAKAIRAFKDFSRAEAELKFISKYKIKPLFITDDDYPKRLRNCYDSPVILYYKGVADLNSSKIVAIVGTRNNDNYGKTVCEEFIEAFNQHHVLVCSGMAFGIDTIAHKAAIKHGLPTVGVLAHGLDRIYPPQNKALAKQMMENGGLLTDFPSATNPDKQNFPKRNRIVAGMCDAVLVIQTGEKGGSLITAELANGYNRDVFAVPGRIHDPKSAGCNLLISDNKASLITSADQLLDMMGWKDRLVTKPITQRQLFIQLTDDERSITNILSEVSSIQIDELHFRSGLTSSAVASALLSLEMQGVVEALPGKVYRLC